MVRALAVVVILAFASPGYPLKRVGVGDPLKDFTLESPEGELLRLSQGLGREATLVVFWAAWSPRSGEALRDFQGLYEDFGPRDLQVVGVNVEGEDPSAGDLDRVRAYARERGVRFPVVVDRDLAAFEAYGVVAVPTALLLDAGGRIVQILEGYANTTRGAFRDRVLEALGEPIGGAGPPRGPETPACPGGPAVRYYRMGEILLRKQMEERAVEMLERAAEADPECAAVLQRLAEALEGAGRVEAAAAVRARAAALGTPDPQHPSSGAPGDERR